MNKLTPSYLKEAQQSEALWEGGYLHTQDIAVIEENGYVTIVDRKKDVIKSGGEWISSLELENVMGMHDCVAEIAVVARPDEKWDERPLVLIVLKEGVDAASFDPDSVLALARQAEKEGHIAHYAVPQDIKIIDEIYKTSIGKIDKKRLRRVYAQKPQPTAG